MKRAYNFVVYDRAVDERSGGVGTGMSGYVNRISIPYDEKSFSLDVEEIRSIWFYLMK